MTVTDRLAGLRTSVAIKAPCRVVTATAIARAGLPVIGGVQVEEGDRVLYAVTAGSVYNGIWNASTGDWQRAVDWNSTNDVVQGTLIHVAQGTGAGDYRVETAGDIVVGGTVVAIASYASGDAAVAAAAAAAAEGSAAAAEDAKDDVLEILDSQNSILALSSIKRYVVGTAGPDDYSGSTTTFPISYQNGMVVVMLNGNVLDDTDYTADNEVSVILADEAATDDVVKILAFGASVALEQALVYLMEEWDEEGSYESFDVVTYNGGSYVARQASVGQAPPAAGVIYNDYWYAQALAGDPGATPDITIGSVLTLAPGAEATVELAEGSTAEDPILEFGIPAGPAGAGLRGWTMVVVDVADGDRVVEQVSGYIGGEGDAPTDYVGQYKTDGGGFTSTIGDAWDKKGPEGDGDMNAVDYPTIVSLEGLTLAAGDILYATGADTLVKLAKGTASQILRMNTGATAPEWNTPSDKSDVTRSINAQTGTTYTFVLGDAGKWCTFSNAAAITVTVPPNSSVAFPVGTQIDCSQPGAGQVTFAQGSGVTINSKSGDKKLTGQYSAATLLKTATDTWLLVGDLAA